jgi:ATP-dependent exoDNAse (exonuclease V) alpha subunit
VAIYRLSAQVISRGDGRSATAAAAYRSGGRIADERTGQLHDYERRSGILHEEIMAPPLTPEWMLDREALWNAVERVEKRRDAQLCRELQLALPHELGRVAQLELVRGFVGREFVARGMIADIAVHASHRKGDARNEHAHVMLTLREITKAGFGNKERSWNDRALLGHWREEWAEHVNRALSRAGHDERVDHRTLEAQRADVERQAAEARAANDNDRAHVLEVEAVILDREPQPKIGHIATALERQGQRTERGDLWRAVMARNFARLRQWVALQRDRVATVWGLVQAVFERDHGRVPTDPARAGSQPTTAPAHREGQSGYSQEERDRLMGRRPPADRAQPTERRGPNRPRGRDDDRER